MHACFCTSRHPGSRHPHHQGHTERWGLQSTAVVVQGRNKAGFSPFTEELFHYFCFLQDVFSNEFIFVPGKSFQVVVSPFSSGRRSERGLALSGFDELLIGGFIKQDFQEACLLLKKCGAVHVTQQEVMVSETGREVLDFLQTLLQPFINSYQVFLKSNHRTKPL